jgi:hypothetical protein
LPLPEDILVRVRHDFSEDDSLQALRILRDLKQENPDLFNDRILRCLVVSSGGRVEKLSKAVKMARGDGRDLIMDAEYEWGNRVRLLELPFDTHPEAESGRQWLVGQQIAVPWGVGSDASWTIEHSEIREFSLISGGQYKPAAPRVVDPNLYVLHFSFLCIHGTQEISASKAIEGKAFFIYRRLPESGEFILQKFYCRPQDLGKRGLWTTTIIDGATPD